MSDTHRVRPKAGMVYLMPEKGYTPMPPEGADVSVIDPYYHRGILDGDLEIVTPAPAQTTRKSKEGSAE